MNSKVAFAIFAAIIAAAMFVIGHLVAFAACWVGYVLGFAVDVGAPWRMMAMPQGQWYFASFLALGGTAVAILAYLNLLRETVPEPNPWKKPERTDR